MPDEALSRRQLLKATSLGWVGALSPVVLSAAEASAAEASAARTSAAGAEPQRYWTAEYWAPKGALKLYLYRKRREAPHAGESPLPVVFFAHGSSLSARTTYDLEVPGRGEYSMMNVFAAAGFDTWTMDFEGYGRSALGDDNSDVRTGVADLTAALPLLERETGRSRFHFYGESSGALRAAAFAMDRPERIDRLVLTAFTYTGRGSPTLTQRARQLEYYRTHRLRKRDRAMIESIYSRDKPGTTDPAVVAAVADAELRYGPNVPTGTYLDMTANLPLVDPLKVLAPTLLLRGQYDGIATLQDLLDFFTRLPNGDRQFSIIPNAAHAVGTSYNRALLWHTTLAFLRMPASRPLQPAA
jgi:alpha-beta hydrolase superfamily lysophospholipase